MSREQEGLEVLHTVAEQAREDNVADIRYGRNNTKGVGVYVVWATHNGEARGIAFIPDIGKFADEHQRLLDRKQRLNGVRAALELLKSSKYHVTYIS